MCKDIGINCKNIILDLNHRDKLLEGEVTILSPKKILVKRRSESWAKDQYVFALIELNTPFQYTKVECNGEHGKTFKGTELAISISMNVKKKDKILVKVALSTTGFEGAKLNSSEIKYWDFEKVKQDAEQLWNKQFPKNYRHNTSA